MRTGEPLLKRCLHSKNHHGTRRCRHASVAVSCFVSSWKMTATRHSVSHLGHLPRLPSADSVFMHNSACSAAVHLPDGQLMLSGEHSILLCPPTYSTAAVSSEAHWRPQEWVPPILVVRPKATVDLRRYFSHSILMNSYNFSLFVFTFVSAISMTDANTQLPRAKDMLHRSVYTIAIHIWIRHSKR